MQRKALLEEHRELALSDDFGHGTHVAGIIAGAAKKDTEVRSAGADRALERRASLERGQFQHAGTVPAEQVRGMAPNCRLISLRVLDSNGEGRSSDVIRALAYVHERLNDNPKLLRVHGVNLSVGYEFDAEMFACGQSPICAEVNRLVQSGVVVVAAAGNTGFGTVAAAVRPTKVGLSNTINDPGNAELGDHRRRHPSRLAVHVSACPISRRKGPPATAGSSRISVAPGERITSCGAGSRLKKAMTRRELRGRWRSGLLHGRQRHEHGRAARVGRHRRVPVDPPGVHRQATRSEADLSSTASPLGRERYFEGHGLIDLIRAIQSV